MTEGNAKLKKANRPPQPCSICQKMSVEKYHPFCSIRCANIDLNRWLKGTYAIASEEQAPSLDEDLGPDIMDG